MGDAMVGRWGDSACVHPRNKAACGRTETSNFNFNFKITTQVDELKDSKVGHLIVRFADKEKLENARKEFEKNMVLINISVVEKEKNKAENQSIAM